MALRLLDPPVEKNLPLLRKPAEEYLSYQKSPDISPGFIREKPNILRRITNAFMQMNPVESLSRTTEELDYIKKHKEKFGKEPSLKDLTSFENFYQSEKERKPIVEQLEMPLTAAATSFAAAKPLVNIPKILAFSGIQAVNPIGKIKTENQTGQDVRDIASMLTSGGLVEGAARLPKTAKLSQMEGVLTDVAKNISVFEKAISKEIREAPGFKDFWEGLSPRGKAVQVVKAAENDPNVGNIVRDIIVRESVGRRKGLLTGEAGEAKLPPPGEPIKPKDIAGVSAGAGVPPVIKPTEKAPPAPIPQGKEGVVEPVGKNIVYRAEVSGKGKGKGMYVTSDKSYAEHYLDFEEKTGKKIGQVDTYEILPEAKIYDAKNSEKLYEELFNEKMITEENSGDTEDFLISLRKGERKINEELKGRGFDVVRYEEETADDFYEQNTGKKGSAQVILNPKVIKKLSKQGGEKAIQDYSESAKKKIEAFKAETMPVKQPDLWPEEKPPEPVISEPVKTPIEEQAEMEIETLNYTGGQHPLEKAIGNLGKIRIEPGQVEEFKEIPIRFKSNKGRPIDEIRRELEAQHGIAFDSDSELRQALKELGDKQQRATLSPEVQAYLKTKVNVEKLGKQMENKLSPSAYKRIIYSNVGLKPSKTPFVSTKEKMLKYTLKQREIAARGGFKSGRRELKVEQRAKKQERARQIEAGKRFPREQRYEIYKAARKAGLILYEKKDPISGQITQKYKNKLSPLLRFYNKASFEEIMGYIRALRGDPENPPLLFKLSGDPTTDSETMKLIDEASKDWQDINRLEIGTLDLPRQVEKVTGNEIFEDNILADNTYEALKGADDARFQRMSEELQALENNAKEFAAETKASAELMRKFEEGENLTDKEKKAADYLRSKYDELIKEANENRERLGKKPIPYRKDYMTHIRDWNLLTAFFKGDQKAIDNLTNEQWQALAKGQYSKISVPFNQFAQKRMGKKTKYDAIGNYKKYLETILYEIYMSPAIAHARKFTDYALLKLPNAKVSMDQLLDELTGKPSSFDHIAIRPIVSNSFIKWINNRFGANALIGNISYYLMNASNIATASGELGNYTIKGMHGFLSNPYLRQLAFQKSSLLKSRQGLFDYEISRLEAFFAGHGKDLTMVENLKLKDKQLEYVISSINRIIEYNNVGSSWVGAYMKAIDKFKYAPEKAYKYADSVARKTQGGYRPYEMPGWMRSDLGKLASKFGTWAFNMMNYLLYDLKLANLPSKVTGKGKPVHFGKFIVLAATLMFVNAMYRKAGLREPYSPKSFIPQTPITRGRYEQPPIGRLATDVQTITPLGIRNMIPFAEKQKHRPETRGKALEELLFMLGPRYGGAQLRRLFHGDILPVKKEKGNLRLLGR